MNNKPPFTLHLRDGDKEIIINSLEEAQSLIGCSQYLITDADGKTVTGGDMGWASIFGMGSQEAHKIANGIK